MYIFVLWYLTFQRMWGVNTLVWGNLIAHINVVKVEHDDEILTFSTN